MSPYQFFYYGLWWCRRFNKDDLFSPPFVHCRHFGHTSADMHTRPLPWLPEHIKRPRIKSGASIQEGEERAGLGNNKLDRFSVPWQMGGTGWCLICGLVGGFTDTYSALPGLQVTSYFLLLAAYFESHRTSSAATVILTFQPTLCVKNLKLANIAPVLQGTPTDRVRQQSDVSKLHLWENQAFVTPAQKILTYSNLP